MKVGFIGLGNVGGKLAGSLLRNGVDLTVHDLNAASGGGVRRARAPRRAAARRDDARLRCGHHLPALARRLRRGDRRRCCRRWRPGKIWMEMSTTDEAEVKRLGARGASQRGGAAVDCPVSGGCHRAATGNISIFAGCDRATFERMLPLLTIMGRRVLHTGPSGLGLGAEGDDQLPRHRQPADLCEALVTMKAAGMDLATTYEAIRISSGTSFVHETESQVILNGSRDINFTMDLVQKDIGLFQKIADDHDVPLELSPMMIEIMTDGQKLFGQQRAVRPDHRAAGRGDRA